MGLIDRIDGPSIPNASTHRELTARFASSRPALAMLRAVAAGRADLVLGRDFTMLIDGVPCGDQVVAHNLARSGLVRQSRPGLIGHRVPAILTRTGHATLRATPTVA